MAKSTPEVAVAQKKRTKLPLLMGLVLMLLSGGIGFYAVYSGAILATIPSSADVAAQEVAPGVLPDIAFVVLDPMVVSLGSSGTTRHLKFSAQLEVPSKYLKDVELLRPRVVDVLNGYLRAVELADLEDRSALIRLRAQMLRRIQIVTGEGRVRDLLIIEFVLN